MVSTLRRAIALLLIVLALGMTSCGGDRDVPVVLLAEDETEQTDNPLIGAIAEVSPPERIQQLKPYLDVYEPQVRIASPDPDETLTSTTVQVRLQVRDFPIYKDQALGFGPHLHLFVDDQPHQAVYDADAPITLENLAPGTHTLRLLAVRPWGESFKNAGAYDQVTFNVFAASPQNHPDDSKPVLTYNQPQDSYGAEPILLDFHLSNAPPHLVAQTDETITDWRIRCTVNGESFIFDRWQPIYLKGFKPGKNWLRLELIDENGNLIENALNTSIRVIDYQPGGKDSLAQLIRGELSLAQAKVLIDPNYEPPVLKVEEPVEEPEEPAVGPAEETREEQPEPTTTSTEPESETVKAPADSAVPPAIEPTESDDRETESRPEVETQPTVDTNDQESESAPVTPEGSETSEEMPESAATPEPADGSETDTAAEEENLDAENANLELSPVETSSAMDEGADLKGDRPALTQPATDQPTVSEDLPTTEEDTDQLAPATPDISDDLAQETESSTATPQEAGESGTESEAIATPKAPDANEDSSMPATPKSDLDGVAADDLTEDSPLMESQDTSFPKDVPAVETPLTPEETAIDKGSKDQPNDLDQPDTQQSPRTDLKTLEDNADLI